jgi:hypothetical protein
VYSRERKKETEQHALSYVFEKKREKETEQRLTTKAII